MSGRTSTLTQVREYEGTVIDADFHLQLPLKKLNRYVDDPMLRDKLEKHGPPREPVLGWKGGYATDSEESAETFHGVAIDREEIADVATDFGLDAVVVDPGTHVPFAAARYPTLKNVLLRAYNNYVLEHVVDVDEGIFAAMVVPSWDPELAVAELDRVGDEQGIVGAQGFFSKMQPWGALEYDPVFDVLTDKDLPLLLHPLGITGRFDPISDTMRTWPELQVVGVGHNMMANVVNLVMTGVFDKFPGLDVVAQEAGTHWIPYLAYRTDEYYQIDSEDVKLAERLYNRDQEYLERLPSEYIFENMYVTTQPIALPPRADQVEAMLTLERAADMFMFSTDWPHNAMDATDWLFDAPAIDADLRERIFHDNAASVHRFPDSV
jgi:predicted TIM-barrel fold metal-dependent hydrolase